MIIKLYVITIVFYNFILRERGLMYVFKIVFNVDWRKIYKINKGMLVKN